MHAFMDQGSRAEQGRVAHGRVQIHYTHSQKRETQREGLTDGCTWGKGDGGAGGSGGGVVVEHHSKPCDRKEYTMTSG